MKIPGSALVFHGKGSKQATELDFIAQITDSHSRPAAVVRDTIPLKLSRDIAGQVIQKSIQYSTGVTLAPGAYKLRFVARENGQGKIGTFETPFNIPDLASSRGLRVSSLVLSSQRQPLSAQVAGVKNSRKLLAENPLLQGGQQLVPNVTGVFRPGQEILAYVEVYDPALPASLPENLQRPDIDASLAVYKGGKKLFETPPARVTRLEPQRKSVLPVWLNIPAGKIPPGEYDCQVNLIDEFGRKFAFPRSPFAVVGSTYVSKLIP